MKHSLWLSLVLYVVPIYAQNPIGTANRVIQGSGVPSSLACQDIGDVGKVYARNDGAAANTTFYTCGNTGVGTYAWELSGGGSGGGVISFNTRTGAVTLSSGDVTTALGFTPAGLGANTFTGQQILSLNVVAGTPPLKLTGTWATGATSCAGLIQDSGATVFSGAANGNGLCVNAAAGFSNTGRLLDLQRDGVSQSFITGNGYLSVAGAHLYAGNGLGTAANYTVGINDPIVGVAIAGSGGALAFSTNGVASSTLDTSLYRSAAGTVCIGLGGTSGCGGSLGAVNAVLTGTITYNASAPPTNSVVCFKAGGVMGYATNTSGVIGTTCN